MQSEREGNRTDGGKDVLPLAAVNVQLAVSNKQATREQMVSLPPPASHELYSLMESGLILAAHQT